MTAKKSVGQPSKVKELIKANNWKKIVDYIEYQMPRDAIAKLMGCNKDTLLKAIKEKGYESYQDLKNQVEGNFRFENKKKIFGEIKAGTASDKVKLFWLEKYCLPFEEFNKKQEEENNVKTVYVPIVDFGSPEEMQKHVEMQQSKLKEELNEQKRKLDGEEQ
jgi:hypothetical protein